MNKLYNIPLALTFDDVMLVPQHSEVMSRRDPKTWTGLSKKITLSIPIIASPMNTVTEKKMVGAMFEAGGSSVLHRYMSMADQYQQCLDILHENKGIDDANNFFVAVGATDDYLRRIYKLYEEIGITNFCIDVANGHSEICLNAIRTIRKEFGEVLDIMAGNVCTYHGAAALVEAGANIIRVGVGPGSMCKTRIVTGHGVPQLTAIDDCAKVKEHFKDVSIVADGGIRNSGDIVKALAIGADAVMLGSLLAGTTETPGPVIDNGQINFMGIAPWKPGKFKKYAGMASQEGRQFNGWFSETEASFIPEGEATEVPYRGPVQKVIDNLVGGLRVGMSYAGAHTIKELQENAEFIRVTENGRVEGTPHGKM